MYSFPANGGLNICTKVSSVIAKKPPIARTGLVAVYVDTIRGVPATRSLAGCTGGAVRRCGHGELLRPGRPGSPAAADSHDQPAAWPERYEADSMVTAPPGGIMRPSSEAPGSGLLSRQKRCASACRM